MRLSLWRKRWATWSRKEESEIVASSGGAAARIPVKGRVGAGGCGGEGEGGEVVLGRGAQWGG